MDQDNKYAIRKFTVGSFSVLISSFFFLSGANQVSVSTQDIAPEVSVSLTDDAVSKADQKLIESPNDPLQADKFNPQATVESIEIGETVHLIDHVKVPDYVKDLDFKGQPKFEDITPSGVIDTTKAGEYTGNVKVIYPDGSFETINVPVVVINSVVP
ncbi:Rib/alpha-like domain-containing protein [Facklamia sp. P12937]|uniref:Rib/alpha-like domain-containing protein n=1 Tax=unclassified Facklamia TaxID=2622293 RepID=UPI003D173F13